MYLAAGTFDFMGALRLWRSVVFRLGHRGNGSSTRRCDGDSAGECEDERQWRNSKSAHKYSLYAVSDLAAEAGSGLEQGWISIKNSEDQDTCFYKPKACVNFHKDFEGLSLDVTFYLEERLESPLQPTMPLWVRYHCGQCFKKVNLPL